MARRIAAQAQIKKGKTLLKAGKIDEAIAAFNRAIEIDNRFNGLPLVASHYMETGEKLAKEGKIDQAIVQFKKVMAQDSTWHFVPEKRTKRLFSLALVEQGKKLAKEGKIKEAIAKYQAAQQMDSHLKISASSWNTLCWYGSKSGNAVKVIDACEKAVVLEPKDKNYRRSRGLVRALTDNIQGAIADFQFVVEQTKNDKRKQQVQGWLDALQKGENPFTEKVLKELR